MLRTRYLSATAAVAVAGAVAVATLSVGSADASAPPEPPVAEAAPGSPAEVVGLRYVAMGDSYTSAPGVLPVSPSAPAVCGQSAGNYPHLLAGAIGAELIDVSCGGAKTEHFFDAQLSGVPAQLDALSRDTALVTVGIGGNDNNLFATAIAGCATTVFDVLAGSTAPCRERFGDRFSKDIQASSVVVGSALRAIRKQAPDAQVLVVGYPNLLPTTTAGQVGCAAAGVPFTPDDIAYLDEVERELNAMLRAAANAARATYLDTYTPSVGHDMCQLPAVRWIEPLIPLSPAAPVHPNAAGQAAVARALQAVVQIAP